MARNPEKSILRTHLKRLRDALSPEDRKAFSDAIHAQVMTWVHQRRPLAVASYASWQSEVSTLELNRSLASRGRLALPRIDREGLVFAEVGCLDTDLMGGFCGIPEPRPECSRVSLEELDLMIVPLVGFDADCNRLGYGGGYYDRIRQRHPVFSIGLAYECQKSAVLPLEPHDIPLDAVVTELHIHYRKTS